MFDSSVLKNYFAIVEGKKEPKFLQLKKPGKLQEKTKKAFQLFSPCNLCERHCSALRPEQAGNCGAKELKVSSVFNHFGEELFFIPSLTVFFSACNFHCVYCQNYDISQNCEGRLYSTIELANAINRNAIHSKNLNFVGGSPTPFLPFILEALEKVQVQLPIVWNSNFFMSKQTMQVLKGVVDVYLSDWKYGNDKCAEKLSKIENYCRIVERNHKLAFNDAELVIRHLVLPNHFECCTKPILEKIAKLFGKKVVVNVMEQYRPAWHAFEHQEISKPLSRQEFLQALNFAQQLGLNICPR